MNERLYIAVFVLAAGRHITVGRLGRRFFRQGMYLYVGSARRNLAARLARHARKNKPLHWHIDYLSARADMLGVVLVYGPNQSECRLAEELAQLYQLAIPGFGSSDCRCPGHLFYTPKTVPGQT